MLESKRRLLQCLLSSTGCQWCCCFLSMQSSNCCYSLAIKFSFQSWGCWNFFYAAFWWFLLRILYGCLLTSWRKPRLKSVLFLLVCVPANVMNCRWLADCQETRVILRDELVLKCLLLLEGDSHLLLSMHSSLLCVRFWRQHGKLGWYPCSLRWYACLLTSWKSTLHDISSAITYHED